MKICENNRRIRKRILWLAIICVLLTLLKVQAKGAVLHHSYTGEDLVSVMNGILDWQKEQAGIDPESKFLQGQLIGEDFDEITDWYVIAMSQGGYEDDYTAYRENMQNLVIKAYQTEKKLSRSRATQ